MTDHTTKVVMGVLWTMPLISSSKMVELTLMKIILTQPGMDSVTNTGSVSSSIQRTSTIMGEHLWERITSDYFSFALCRKMRKLSQLMVTKMFLHMTRRHCKRLLLTSLSALLLKPVAGISSYTLM